MRFTEDRGVVPEYQGTMLGWCRYRRIGKPEFLSLRGHLVAVRVSSTAHYRDALGPTTDWVRDDDTVALYRIDQPDESNLEDASGNNHTERILGAEWASVTLATDAPPSPSSGNESDCHATV